MEKIELLYFYFLQHKFLKNLGINLSQEFYFSIDEDDNLNIKPIKSVNLFKDSTISNLNLLVGKNGSGKTTVIREIYSFLHGFVDDKKIIILKKNQTIFIYCSNKKIKINEQKFKDTCPQYEFIIVNEGFILNNIDSKDIDGDELKAEVKNLVYISDFIDGSTERGSQWFFFILNFLKYSLNKAIS